jgi:hypothetical protein
MLKGRVLESEALARLLKLSEAEGVDLVDWFPRGIPNPDALAGSFLVKRQSVPSLVQEILNLQGLRLRLDIFPYGIPNPEGVFVNFRTH